MDWIDEAEREVVERILVLLALLSGHAGGADRIARLPLILRLPVLLALSRAEAAAQSFLAGLAPAALTGPAAAHLAGLAPDGSPFDDLPENRTWAERLAARLLALAAVLSLVLARAASETPSRPWAAALQSLRSAAPCPVAASPFRGPPATPAPDTS